MAYQIGNRHFPLDIAEDGLKTLYEPILAACLSQQKIAAERLQLPLTPVQAASGHA